MDGSEAHGLWHCVSLIFLIFAILRNRNWPNLYYQNSFVFMNETGKSFPGASPHEEHDVKTSVSDLHAQHKIWMLL